MTKTATPTASLQLTTSQILNTIIAEIDTEFFERRAHLEAIFIAMLAGENVFLLGPPGTGKSAMIRRICKAIMGAIMFDMLLNRQLPDTALFGAIDMVLYDTTGVWKRNTTGKLPEAHLVFLDEIGKAGPSCTDPLLTAMNEHVFHNEDGMMELPMISTIGASNEELEMPEQAAVWDRFPIRMEVLPIQERGNMLAFLRSKVVKPNRPAPTTLPLAALLYARDVEVPAIDVPEGVLDTMLQLESALMAEEIRPSNRRVGQCIQLLQASAYLAGRTKVEEDDLSVLRHVLWEDKSQIAKVEKTVLSLTSELTRAALDLEGQIDDIVVQISGSKGQANEKKALLAAQTKLSLRQIGTKLQAVIGEAEKKGKSTTRLVQVRDRHRMATVRVHVDLMNVDEERALKIVAAELD